MSLGELKGLTSFACCQQQGMHHPALVDTVHYCVKKGRYWPIRSGTGGFPREKTSIIALSQGMNTHMTTDDVCVLLSLPITVYNEFLLYWLLLR